MDNTQDILFGGFVPNSSSVELLSKALDTRTVVSLATTVLLFGLLGVTVAFRRRKTN